MVREAPEDTQPRSRVGAVIAMVILVVAVPLTCVAAFAFYGKVMSEGEVAVGKVLTLEEMRSRLEEAQRAFRAMTPAAHLDAARQLLERGYDAQAGLGGHVLEAARHLDAVPEGAPERAEATRLLAEIAQRRERIWSHAATSMRVSTLEATATGDTDVRALERSRHMLARRLDRLAPLGLGCVHAIGEGHTVLQFDAPECSAARLDQGAPPDLRPALHRVGFRRVQCRAAGVGVDL